MIFCIRTNVHDTEQNILLDRLLREKPASVVDLGAGLGRHAGYLLEHGVRVTATDRVLTDSLQQIVSQHKDCASFVQGDATDLPFPAGSQAAIWSSHTLEHLTDPLGALRHWRDVLCPGGILAVVVPPFKTEVVGRHVFTGWTVGQLMLTLLRAGFDIRGGSYVRHLYNICGIVRRAENPPAIEPNDEILCRLHHLFPPSIEAEILARRRVNPFGETISSFEGDIQSLNW